MAKKLKEFFIKKQRPQFITLWYHGFFYNKYDTNEYVTVLLPLAPFARLLRALYLHCKFGSHDLRQYYNNQARLRGMKKD
jgi:hypothetical protein